MTMRPKIEKGNFQKVLSHPGLFFHWLQGYDEEKLAKEHIEHHLKNLAKLKLDATNLSPIDVVCYAIDLHVPGLPWLRGQAPVR